MRKTAKYTAGLAVRRLMLGPGNPGNYVYSLPHDELYTALESDGYYWDSKDGKWQKDQTGNARAQGKMSGSMFEDPQGVATGFYRLRVMAHPDELTEVCTEVCRGLTVLEVSAPYPNRRGAGVRVYITCKVKETS